MMSSKSSSSARNDLDNFSTHSGGTLSINDSASLALGAGDEHNLSQASSTIEQASKYEKLIQDYVKLRSKLSILKKAYIELSDSCAQKDQSIRKYEQEIEGLTFRNQQLTSRVEILQRDLDSYSTSSLSTTSSSMQQNGSGNILTPINHINSSNSLNSSINIKLSPSNSITATSTNNTSSNSLLASSHHSSSSSLTTLGLFNGNSTSLIAPAATSPTGGIGVAPRVDILTEELQHKINENTQLHKRLGDLEVEFRQKLAKTEQSLKQIEYEKLLLEKKLESCESTSKSTIEKLQNDKIKLELNIIQLENQLRETHHEKELKENELLRKENELLKQFEQNEQLNKHSSSSSSSLSSIVVTNKRDSLNEDLFFNCYRTILDSLMRTYSSIEERNSIVKVVSLKKVIVNVIFLNLFRFHFEIWTQYSFLLNKQMKNIIKLRKFDNLILNVVLSKNIT